LADFQYLAVTVTVSSTYVAPQEQLSYYFRVEYSRNAFKLL